MLSIINNRITALFRAITQTRVPTDYYETDERKLHSLNILTSVVRNESFNNSNLLLNLLLESKAQNLQDIFVLDLLMYKSHGYFVEFGATDGILNSNTFLLENRFNWNGILAEPNPYWHESLRQNRTAHISDKCVYSESGIYMDFEESNNRELSAIAKHRDNGHRKDAKVVSRFKVETISLEDLLSSFNAPFEIDLVSIDTEGSEFEIMSNFNFSSYRIALFIIEHNFSSNRSKTIELLEANGYVHLSGYSTNQDDYFLLSK